MLELFQPLYAAPVLPASVLLVILLAWSLLTITVGIGADFDGHLPFHIHTPIHGWLHGISESLGSVILTPSNWLNLRSIPLVLWLGIFSIVWFAVSLGLWVAIDEWLLGTPHALVTMGLWVRNFAIALPITKFATQPMKKWLANTPELNAKSLIGAEAEICSFDATPENGQARFKTDGAPLLLNVRTDGVHLTKGAHVWITHYDVKRRVYIVSPTTVSSDSTSR